MQTHEASRRPRYVAMDLADRFINAACPNADNERHERIQTTILCAGQHLADCGVPGVWDALEPASFLEKMPARDGAELVYICIDLAGLYGWLGVNELIDPVTAAEVLTGLRVAGPDEQILHDLCDKGVAVLSEMSDG